jgi:signal transduction histidine kinase
VTPHMLEMKPTASWHEAPRAGAESMPTSAARLHDLRNLLALVASGANLLRAPLEADRRGVLVDSIQQALAGLEQLATAALPGEHTAGRQEIDLGAFLARAAPLYRCRLPANILLKVEVRPAGARMLTDPARLSAALLNLVLNARDAMPRGGQLVIRVRPIGKAVRLILADTGTGMDSTTLQRAFLPYFTTKRGTGSGQGLPQVRRFVEDLGGCLRVRSRAGRGTMFVLDFPGKADAARSHGGGVSPSAVIFPPRLATG